MTTIDESWLAERERIVSLHGYYKEDVCLLLLIAEVRRLRAELHKASETIDCLQGRIDFMVKNGGDT